MIHPMIGGTLRNANTGDFRFILVATHAPPIVAISCTAPNGMLNRIVANLSYPKDLMIKGPNVEMPPDGTEMPPDGTEMENIMNA
jgi:hypothetical protein